MRKCDEFHPFFNFIYYAGAIGFLCFHIHPVFVLVGFLGVLVTDCLQREFPSSREIGCFLLLFVAVSFVNPIFNHNGSTVLFYVNSVPITLEAFLYGVNMSALLVTMLLWCRQMSRVFHEEQILFLIGRVSQKSALILSMSLKWIPAYRKHMQEVRAVQKGFGCLQEESLMDRIKNEISYFSATITWALEHSMETSDSMRARGYGVKRRSHYATYSFRLVDKLLCGIEIVLIVFLVIFQRIQPGTVYFYPKISFPECQPLFWLEVVIFLGYLVFPSVCKIKMKINL